MNAAFPLRPIADMVGSDGQISDGDWIESKDQDPNGEVRLIQLADIGNGRYINKSSRFLTKETASRLKCTSLQVGDILIARMPDPIGRACIFPGDSKEAITVVDVCILRVDAKITEARWLMSAINADFTRRAIEKAAGGTTRTRVSRGSLEKLLLPTPPFPEQKKIAAILTAVDDKLDVIARQIETAQTLKHGLMQTLFSRGVGAQNAGDWPVVALHEVAEVRTGVAKGKKGLKKPVELPYLRVANVQDGHIDISEVKTIEVEGAQVERYALQSGDVLMTEGGDFDKLGRGDVWEGQISPCLHQNHVFAVRPDPGKLNSYYLAALAASDYGRRYFLSCAKRTTNLASINSSQLKAFPVLLPSLAVQDNIAEIVDAANAKVAVLEKKQTLYQTLKRGLMQKLLTGEWRVKVETAMPEAEAEAEVTA